MINTRTELDAALYQLHASLPLWRKATATEEELWSKYSYLFGRILEKTPLGDRDYAIAHLNSIVASTGLLGREH